MCGMSSLVIYFNNIGHEIWEENMTTSSEILIVNIPP